MKKPSGTASWKKWDWFRISGILFGIWAAINTSVAIFRYGLDQGTYWWFCNLALIGTSWGLLARSRAILLGFLSIACFTQVFWLFDNVSRLFLGRNVFGLVEFMYQPGLGMPEFLLAHYHYFTIPVCLFALYFLEKKRSFAAKGICIINPAIFAISYFVFPPEQNINCIHEPCFAGMQHLAGPVYSFTFAATIFVMNIAFAFAFEHLYTVLKRTPRRKQKLVQAFVSFTAVALGLTAWDAQYKLTLPNLVCAPGTETETSKIACAYTLDHSPGNMLFRYQVKNKTANGLICTTRAKTQYTEFVLNEGVALEPGESRQVSQVLPYPDVSVDVTLLADCQDSEDRGIASKPR